MNPAFQIFRGLSRVARNTPLQKMPWASRLHDRLHALVGGSQPPFRVGPFEVDVDARDRLLCKKLGLYGAYEPFQTSLMLDLLKPGDTFVDVGANVGLHTLWASRKLGPTGTVVAFEPDPDNLRFLRANLARNECTNVEVVAAAVSDRRGTADLYQNEHNRGNLSLSSHGDTGEYVAVPTQTLDESLTNHRNLALIKIDVEGAEPLVLDGATHTLQANPSCAIVIEIAPRLLSGFGFTPGDIERRLLDQGFEIHAIDEQRQVLRPCPIGSIDAASASGNVRNLLCLR